MIYFVDNNGTVIDALTTPVNQGSVDTNNIYLIAPFASNLQFAVAFQLPNGLYTERYVMTPVGEIPNVQYAPTSTPYSIWSFTMPNDITQYYGTVYAQFYAYGTNGQITATSRTSFVVAAGVPEQLPSTPTQDVYNQILTALSQYSSQLNSGAYAARSIYWWIDTFTYGMNEITFYPVGTYGAFVKSIVTNNTGNQPYNSDGVLNSEYWAELANLNSIFDEAVNAQGSAAAAAASAEQAAQSATAAEQSATTAQQAATAAESATGSAAGSATAAEQSASLAANSAQSALTSANEAATSADTAQQAAQELTDNLNKTTVFVDQLPATGDSQYLYFIAGADNNLFSIYTWDGAWQLLGSANLVVNNTKTYNLTLLSTAWSGNQQTLTVDGISDTDNVNIYPAEGYSDEYINYGIQAVSTSSNGVTFSCTSVPSENISVVVSVDTEVDIPTANEYYTQAQSNTLFASTGTLTMDPSTFIITMTLKSISGATLVTQSIDLPVESMVVGATYDSGTKSIILTLQNGNTVSVPVGDLVNGLATTAQLNAETSAREAADTNLQNQINKIKNGTTVVGAAERLSNTTAVGSSTKPVYFSSGGVPVTCGSSLAVNITGSAASASKLSNTSAVGSTTQPVYFTSGGVPAACGGSLDVSITGNAATATTATNASQLGGVAASEYAHTDGSYPTLGAGYLPYWSARAEGSAQVGWHLIASIENRAPYGNRIYSCILLVNGSYPQQGENNAEESGKLEIDVRLASKEYSGLHLSVLSGNINPNEYCAVIEGTTLKVYANLPRSYATRTFVIQSEMIEAYLAVGTLQTQDTYYGASAPSGAVYAVNRNYAAQVENALTLVAGATTKTYNGSEAVTFNVTSQAGQAVYQSISIPTSAWSGNSATVTVSGATSSAYIEASAADTNSAAQVVNNNIVATAAGTNTVTFTADSTPTTTVNMNILIIY